MDLLYKSEEEVFNGVKEVFNERVNSFKIALWSTGIMFMFLTAFNTLLFLNYISITPLNILISVLVIVFICLCLFLFTYLMNVSGYYGNMTLNSDVGYRNTSDFIVSNFGGSRAALIERSVGHLKVSKQGIAGIVSTSWGSVQNLVALDDTIIKFTKKGLFGSSSVVLQFANSEDAKKFESFAKLNL